MPLLGPSMLPSSRPRGSSSICDNHKFSYCCKKTTSYCPLDSVDDWNLSSPSSRRCLGLVLWGFGPSSSQSISRRDDLILLLCCVCPRERANSSIAIHYLTVPSSFDTAIARRNSRIGTLRHSMVQALDRSIIEDVITSSHQKELLKSDEASFLRFDSQDVLVRQFIVVS